MENGGLQDQGSRVASSGYSTRMRETADIPFLPGRAIAEILVITGLCILGMSLFLFLGMFLLMLALGLQNPSDAQFGTLREMGSSGRIGLLFLQGIVALGAFVATPWFVRFLMPGSPFEGPRPVRPGVTLVLLVAGLALLMMPVNSWLSSWNQSLQPPSFMEGFYRWALEKEKEMEEMVLFLVSFSSLPEAFAGFLVIAVVAGVSEEFFFRKLLQPRILGLTGNLHVAVWLTAAIFSAIHLQFMGFLPRMALGALFGYYYAWTGNIFLPVLGHVLNNSITLLALYLYQTRISPINVEDPQQIPWYIGAVAAGVTWSLASMVKDEAEKIRSRHSSSAL